MFLAPRISPSPWNVTGTACSGLGSPCGAITSSGVYTAPISTPSPNAINVVATSSEDSSRTGTSSVTITSAMVITGLLPASASVGGAGSFHASSDWRKFLPTSPGPGSAIVVGGTARTTLCATSGTCTTALTSPIWQRREIYLSRSEIKNLTQSNTVNFVVVSAPPAIDIIPLTPTNPSATGKDIIVVEPSTAGSLAPQQNVTIAVAAMGIFSPRRTLAAWDGLAHRYAALPLAQRSWTFAFSPSAAWIHRSLIR